MAENSKHVTWEVLKYYDTQIKQYVDDVVKELNNSSATPEEIADIQRRLDRLALAAVENKTRIDELFTANGDNKVNIDKLFTLQAEDSKDIRELQTRIEYMVTKEDLAQVSGDIKVILDDINELENKIETDHVTLEEVRIALENIATEGEIEGINQELAALQQQVEDLTEASATKEYVDQAIANAQIGGEVNLDNYYTKEETDAQIKEAIDAVETTVDLSGYYTSEQTDNLLKDYAYKADLDELKERVDTIKVPTNVSELVNDSKYATQEYVKSEIAKAKIPEGEEVTEAELEKVLANYYTKSEVDEKNYATQKDLEGYSKFSGSYNDLTDTPDIPSIEGLAAESYVDDKIAEVKDLIPDVSGFITSIPDNYVTDAELTDYATKEYVDNIVADITVSETELYKVDYNAPDYPAAVAAYNDGKVLVLINAAPDINSYAIMNYVSDRYITFTKFLMSRSTQAYGAFNTYYLSSNNVWEVAKEVRLNKVEANVEGECTGELKTIKIGTELYALPDLTGYATEEWVTARIAEAELSGGGSDIDLSKYALKSEVPAKVSQLENDKGYITEIPDEYITAAELDDKNFATKADIADIDAKISTNYYTKEEVNNLVPDISDLATKEELQEAIDSIEHPTVDLDPYATIEYVDAKASDINAVTEKQRYEVIRVPGLRVTYRDDEIRVNTEHITLDQQNVGEGGDPNGYHIGIRIYAPDNATHVKQIITSTPGNFGDKEAVQFTESDIDRYGRKYSNAWVKCATYNTADGTWLNYGLNSTADKCLGYYYSVEWYDAEGNVIESDNIHVVFTNDACHYSAISDAITRRIVAVETELDNIVIPQVPTKVSELENDKGYITEEALKGYATVDQILTDYYTRTETDAEIKKAVNAINIPDVSNKVDRDELSSYTTKDEFNVVQQQSASNNVKILQIDEELVGINQRIDNLPVVETDHLATKDEVKIVENKVDAIKVPTQTSELENNSGYITEQRLTEYAKLEVVENKADKSELEDLASKSYINTTLEDYAKKSDIPSDYATKDELANKADKSELTDYAKITDLASYATSEQLSAKADKTELEGLADKAWVTQELAKIDPTIPSEYITETELEEKGYITSESLNGYAKKSDIPNVDNFATKDDVSAVEDKIPSIEGLATEQFVTEQIANIPSSDLSDYYTKAQTDSAITEAIEGINIPEVNLEPYATKAQVATKADNILFTADMRVNTALGGFVQDESLQNMTIAQIITKLLNLTEYNPPVTPEGILEGTPAAAVNLITNEVPSYMLANSGDIVVNPYNYRLMTITEGAKDNQEESFLYQIIDDNNTAVETGYQITTEFLDAGYLTVLIPATVSDFEVKVYDATAGDWTVPMWTLIENSDYSKDGYVAYTADPSFEIYEGIAIRIVIK